MSRRFLSAKTKHASSCISPSSLTATDMTTIVLVLNGAIRWSASFFLLPATWRRRARFREQLRADIANAPDFLRDIGVDVLEAQAEAMRVFWEPIKLQRKVDDAAAWSLPRHSCQAPAKARMRALTRPTICASRTGTRGGRIVIGKQEDVLARVTSS
jgi:uncharacterized protein YjiS (DUF1127 family)